MSHDVDTVVVGAGITGLVAAWTLTQCRQSVRLIESSDRVGGLIRTSHRDQFLLEHGPFTVLPKSAVFRRILEYAAEELPIVTADPKAKARRFVLQAGELVGIHGRLGPLSTSLYGPLAKLRMVRGLCFSRRGPREETSIYDAVARRFGASFATWAVDPLIRGVVSGDCRKLSLQAMFPPAGELDPLVRSPLLRMAAAATRRRSAPPAPLTTRLDEILPPPRKDSALAGMRRELIGFQDGLQSLPVWIAKQHLSKQVDFGAQVTKIEQTPGGYTVSYHSTAPATDSPKSQLTCRHVILTTPAQPTAALLGTLAPQASLLLQQVHSASLAVAHLGFRAADLASLPDGFGFLVPSVERDYPILGALFASRTFPHHAPDSYELVRVFLGGTAQPNLVNDSDEELLARALEGIRKPLGLRGDPVLVQIDRFHQTIPQYELGHLARIAAVDDAMGSHRSVVLAGSYRDGVSVSDRAAAGFQAAVACIDQ